MNLTGIKSGESGGGMKLRSRVLRAFAGFLAGMLVCTVVSRGVYAWRMPQVTVAMAESGVLSYDFETMGKTEALSVRSVSTVADIRVKEIRVNKGDSVEKGDVLFCLELSDIKNKIKGIQDEIDETEEKIAQHELQEQKMRQTAEQKKKLLKRRLKRQRRRQKEDLKQLKEELDDKVEKMKRQYEKAKKELAAHPSWEIYWEEAKMDSAEFITLWTAAVKKDATAEDKEALELFLMTFERSARKEWNRAGEELSDACRAAQEELREAKKNRKDTLFYQKRQNKRENEDAADNYEDDSDYARMDNDGETQIMLRKKIDKMERSKFIYNNLLMGHGEVVCNKPGVIEQIIISVGENTPEGACVLYSDASKGVRFCTLVNEEQKKYLSVGDSVRLEFGGENRVSDDVTVSGIVSKGDGQYEVSILMMDSSIAPGIAGTMKVSAESERQECLVPVSGLYSGGKEYFVFVLREEETFLGKEYRVEKRKVEIIMKNNEYAALKGAPLGAEEQIVVSSDRQIKAGESVRMPEDDA